MALPTDYRLETAKTPEPVHIFDAFRMASARYHQACEAFQAAARERDESEAQLRKMAGEAEKFIGSELVDHTNQVQPSIPSNGRR